MKPSQWLFLFSDPFVPYQPLRCARDQLRGRQELNPHAGSEYTIPDRRP